MADYPSSDVSSLIRGNAEFVSRLTKMTRHMRFLGIFMIIYGAIYSMGIITAIIGVPVIIAGIRLRDSASCFGRFVSSGVFEDLVTALEKQSRYFLILYVLLIVTLVLVFIYIVIILAAWGTHDLQRYLPTS